MYGGMNRNEITGLAVLIVLVGLGVAARSFVAKSPDGGVWVEGPPAKAERMGGGANANAGTARGAKAEAGDPAKPEMTHKLDLNAATAEQLDALPEVGEVMAKTILIYRERNHGFRRVEDLRSVTGIGEKTWQAILPFVEVKVPAGPPLTAVASPERPQSPTSATVAVGGAALPPVTAPPVASPSPPAQKAVVNINTADETQLDLLDGIGPALAKRVVQWRAAHGPFRAIQDLANVPGIGPVVLRRNPGRITTGR